MAQLKWVVIHEEGHGAAPEEVMIYEFEHRIPAIEEFNHQTQLAHEDPRRNAHKLILAQVVESLGIVHTNARVK